MEWIKTIKKYFKLYFTGRKKNEIIFRNLIEMDNYDKFNALLPNDYETEMEEYDMTDIPEVMYVIHECLELAETRRTYVYHNRNVAYFRFSDLETGTCELAVRKHGMFTSFIVYEAGKKFSVNYLSDMEDNCPELKHELELLVKWLNDKHPENN